MITLPNPNVYLYPKNCHQRMIVILEFMRLIHGADSLHVYPHVFLDFSLRWLLQKVNHKNRPAYFKHKKSIITFNHVDEVLNSFDLILQLFIHWYR